MMIFALASHVGAAELKVGAVADVPCDQIARVPISVSGTAILAGASFTITYDTSALHVMVDSTFFDTFANQGIPQAEIDKVTEEQPLITNHVTGTGTRVAAARATPGDATGDTEIFLLEIGLTSCDNAETVYPIGIVETVINNVDAGYAAEGEAIPYLVGADNTQTDLSLAYPVIDVTSVTAGQVLFAGAPPPDVDGDGIDDPWEDKYFGNDDGTADTTELAAADATSIFQRDGYTDLEEFQNETDPTTMTDPGLPGYTDSDDCRVTGDCPFDGWQATIHAEGEDLGGVMSYDAVIGVASSASTEDAPPAPPSYSVLMQTYMPDWSGPYLKDIRADGDLEYQWIIEINPSGNISPPEERTATLSWDPSQFNPDPEWSYILKEGYEGAWGDVVVADMRQPQNTG